MHWFWLTLSLITYGIGEYGSKQWANKPSWSWIGLLIPSYLAGMVFWLLAMKAKNSLLVLGLVWAVAGTLITVGVALWCGERPTILQVVGTVFCFIGIILLTS